MLPNLLSPIEVRVLSALLEKESTTPEYYPLTLNSLVTACNQKNNRFPCTQYDDVAVTHALELLKNKHYAATIVSGGRALKYAQRFSEALNLGRRELALLCTLMLRGAQTLGELSGRSDRMHHFEDLTQVESVLDHLAAAELAVRLPRGPGQKESRYAHLLSGEPSPQEAAPEEPARTMNPDRFGALEIEVADLRERVRRLEELLEN